MMPREQFALLSPVHGLSTYILYGQRMLTYLRHRVLIVVDQRVYAVEVFYVPLQLVLGGQEKSQLTGKYVTVTARGTMRSNG